MRVAGRRYPGCARLGSIFDRTLHDQRRALAGWAVGLALLAAWLLAVYPTIRDNADMAALLESYPKALREMFHLADFTSGPGYLRAEVFAFTAPVLLIVLGVLWGSDAIAGEEDRHTIGLLLANPVSRRRVVLEKWLAVCSGVLGAAGVLGVALAVGGSAVGLDVPLWRLAAAVLATGLLAVVFASLALAIGAATGHRGFARGATLAAAVVAYLVSSLADVVSWMRPLRGLSPWHHALGVDPIGRGFFPLRLGLLVLLAVAFVGAAAAVFDRRDLAG
jgi:ABC-2 type transport system permease protein